MSGKNHLFIGFDYPTFAPGKNVEGVVVLVVQQQIKVKSINIKWQGKEFVSWFQGVRQNEVTATRSLFEETLLLWPTPSKDAPQGDTQLIEEEKVMNPGTFTYKFCWPLPDDLPGNYEERDADRPYVMAANSFIPRTFGKNKSYIRYLATAFVDSMQDQHEQIDNNNTNNKTKEGNETQTIRRPRLEYSSYFRVVENFDPKIIVQPPKVVEGVKTFFMGGEATKIKVSVANGGVLFCGQRIAMNVDIQNKSNRDINGILLQLEETTALTAQNENFTRKESVIHAEVPDSKVPAGQRFNRDLMMDTPRQFPPTIRRGKHISRTFELVVELAASMGTNFQLRCQILLLGWSPLFKDDVPKIVPIYTNADVPIVPPEKDTEKKEGDGGTKSIEKEVKEPDSKEVRSESVSGDDEVITEKKEKPDPDVEEIQL